MIDKVTKNGNNHGSGHLFNRNVLFTFPGFQHHEFTHPEKGINKSFSLQSSDIINIRRALGNFNAKQGQSTEVNYFGDILTFKVSDIKNENISVELSEIEHTERSPIGLHALPAKMLEQFFFKRFIDEKLTLLLRTEGSQWKPLEMKILPLLGESISTGTKFRFKVEGGSAESRQKALLDFFLAIKHYEEYDIMNEKKPVSQNRFAFRPVFENFIDKEGQCYHITTHQGCLPSIDREETSAYPGHVVAWAYYKTFDKAKEAYARKEQKEISGAVLADTFRRVIDIYVTASKNEKEATRKDDWNKFIDIFDGLQKDLFGELGDDGKITFDFLEGFFEKQRGNVAGKKEADGKEQTRALEDIDLAVNYIVKGLLGEDLDNAIKITEKPIILLTPSLTPKEAEGLPPNVILVLASDIVAHSHPEIILRGRGIKLFRPEGELRELIANKTATSSDPKAMASIIIGGQRIWLNLNLPESLYQYLIYSKGIEEAEALRDLALNGLPRKIRGGRKVTIMANVGGEDIDTVKNLFNLYRPDGIGLFRVELREMSLGAPFSEDELADHVVGLCDAATVEEGGIRFPKPVCLRITDVSCGKRRDKKNVPGIMNPKNLSGAEFLLSEGEGMERLRRDLRAYLKANLKRPGQIKVMIPDVNVAEYKTIKNILQEIKKELSSELNVSMEKLGIPLGGMIEDEQATKEAAELTSEGHFCTFGMNDLRASMGNKPTILYPEILNAINSAIEIAKTSSTPISSCGKIENPNELQAMAALGIYQISVDFREIPKLSRIVRSFAAKELDIVKKEILDLKKPEEIVGTLEKNSTLMGSFLHDEAGSMSQLGFALQHQEIQARFNAIHSTKIEIIDKFLQIANDGQTEKGKRFLSFIEDVQKGTKQQDFNFSIFNCDLTDISRWLEDDMLFFTFLDGWELKEVIGKECRRTPYIFHREPDGTLWARGIPQGLHMGANSRYYIIEEAITALPGDKDEAQLRLFQMNYFDRKERTVKKTACRVQTMKGYTDRYSVAVPTDDENVEVVSVLRRKENGREVFYMQLSGEKLYAAQLIMNQKEVIPDSAITKYSVGDLVGILVTNRERLAEMAAETGVPDIATSFERDRINVFYQSKDSNADNKYNVNQCMYLKIREMDDNTVCVTTVHNWIENADQGRFEPLLDDPKELIEILNFLSIEFEEGKVILRDREERRSLTNQVDSLQKRIDMMMEKAKKLGIDITT